MKKITLSILLIIAGIIGILNAANGQSKPAQKQFKEPRTGKKKIMELATAKNNFIYITDPENFKIPDVDSLIRIDKRFDKVPAQYYILRFFLEYEDANGKEQNKLFVNKHWLKGNEMIYHKAQFVESLPIAKSRDTIPIEKTLKEIYDKATKEGSTYFQLSVILCHLKPQGSKYWEVEVTNNAAFIIVSKPKDENKPQSNGPSHFFAKLLIEKANQEKSYGSSIPVKSLDKNGKVIESTVTDQWGDFSLSVKGKNELRLKIEADLEKGQKLFLAKQTGKLVREIKRNAEGDFMFSILPADIIKLELIEEADPVLKLNDFAKNSDNLMTITKHISFGSNNWQISEKAKTELKSIVSFMKANPKIHLELIGHTDSRGDEKTNLALSNKRVQSIIEYLIQNGIEKGRLTGYGRGESQLLNHCKDDVECSESEHEFNRRVELLFGYPKLVEFGGIVLNEKNKPIAAEISIEDDGHEIKKIKSNPMTGKYKFSANLMQNRDYSLTIVNDNSFVSTTGFKVSESKGENKELANIRTVLPKLKKGGKYTLGNINFKPNSPDLIPASYPSVTSLYMLLKKNPRMIIEIQGHVNHPYNNGACTNPRHQQLSEARAQTVYDILLSKNIKKERLSYIGLGDKEQLYPEAKTEEEEEKNRRVEIKVVRVK